MTPEEKAYLLATLTFGAVGFVIAVVGALIGHRHSETVIAVGQVMMAISSCMLILYGISLPENGGVR